MKDGSGSRGIRLIDPKKSRFDIFIGEKPNSFFTTYDDMISMDHDYGPSFLCMVSKKYIYRGQGEHV